MVNVTAFRPIKDGHTTIPDVSPRN